MLKTYTHQTTVVMGVTCAMRDELIACQHPAESYGESVHMDSDYVFDASVDDSISSETRQELKELIDYDFSSELFIFNP